MIHHRYPEEEVRKGEVDCQSFKETLGLSHNLAQGHLFPLNISSLLTHTIVVLYPALTVRFL